MVFMFRFIVFSSIACVGSGSMFRVYWLLLNIVVVKYSKSSSSSLSQFNLSVRYDAYHRTESRHHHRCHILILFHGKVCSHLDDKL